MDLIVDVKLENEEDFLYIFFLSEGLESFRIFLDLQSGVKFYMNSKQVV